MKEPVEIWATYPEPLHKVDNGELLIGGNNLPELVRYIESSAPDPHYTPFSIPDCWVVMPPKGGHPGPLLEAWREIEAIRERLKAAKQEADHADD